MGLLSGVSAVLHKRYYTFVHTVKVFLSVREKSTFVRVTERGGPPREVFR